MKVVIIVVHLTLLFNFSISNFLIIHWKELINLYRLDEDKWEDFVSEFNDTQYRQTLCESLQKSPIFVNEWITSSAMFLNRKYNFTEGTTSTEPAVQKMQVLVGYNTETVTTLSCEYRESTVYLAKHSNLKHYLFFAEMTSNIPSLIAMVITPALYELPFTAHESKKRLHILFQENNLFKRYNEWRNVRFFYKEEIEFFQYCATVLWLRNQKNILSKENILLKISGHGKNKRITKQMNISLEENTYYYSVPAIQCEVIELEPKHNFESVLYTVFFTPDPTKNGVFLHFNYNLTYFAFYWSMETHTASSQ